MKIIHCADLHLDSKMETHLSKEKARERKNEILITFQNMVEYATKNKVKIIIIAGDMFDKKNVSVKAKKIVKNAIETNPEIDFIYLKGNHDEAGFLDADEEIPQNLKLFKSEEWTTYEYLDNENPTKITISGIEFGGKQEYEIYNSLILDKGKINIVVMHGQESENSVKDKTEIINLKKLKNKNIDYLALGHIHSYKKEKLDNRGEYCYSGCLEGRGFDECGDKGFVLLDIEKGKINSEFIKFAQRTLFEVNVDLTGLTANNEIEEKIKKEIENIPKSSLVKIILGGETEIGEERDVDFLEKKFEPYFYYLKIKDDPKIKIDYMKYQNDISLKGEFIRLVLQQDKLSDEEKSKVISTGIKALSGEEI